MNQLIRAGVVTLGIVGSAGFAAAQQAPGNDHSDLTPTQQRTVSQGLASSPSQPAPAAQPHVGDRLPDSKTAQALHRSGPRCKATAVREAAGPNHTDRSR